MSFRVSAHRREWSIRCLGACIIGASLFAGAALPGADPGPTNGAPEPPAAAPSAPSPDPAAPPPAPAAPETPKEPAPLPAAEPDSLTKTAEAADLSARRAAAESPIQFSLPSPINRLEKAIDFPIDGTFTNRYRLRLTSSRSDQDFFQVLSLRAGNPEKNKLSGAFLGRLSEDIDGRSPRDSFHPFSEITDTYNSNVNGRFYLGYADLRHFGWMDRARLEAIRGGRQSFDESAETFIFDGGRIDTRAMERLMNLRLSAYGGLPVHYYESSTSGDAVGGAGAEASPFDRTRLRADYTFIKDKRAGFDGENNLVSLALWQGVGERINLHGRYNNLDGESRDYLVRGAYREASQDLLLQASFHHVLETLRDLSTELDPYFSILRDYRPYWEVDLRASKGLGEHFLVDAGASLRELIDDADEGTFNHEFRRYYLTPSSRSWPVEGMNLSLTGEVWDSRGDRVYSAGGEVSQRFLKVLVASFGTFYSLYKVDFLSGDERTHDRTFYWKLDYQVLRDLKLTALYELERDDSFTYHTIEVGLRYSF